jgi:predicted AAA+ superfamily ATPase
MLPLSFAEYAQAHGHQASDGLTGAETLYNSYLNDSSFPYALQLSGRTQDITEYLSGLFYSILVKDILVRKQVTDVLLLETIAQYLFSTIGSSLSPTRIANTLTSAGRKTEPRTVNSYLHALRESMLFYQAKRYNIRGQRVLATQEKYYAVDPGLRFVLLGGRGLDISHLLENVIYLELLRRGYEVYVGQVDRTEADFVAIRDGEQCYFQIAATVRDPNTLTRELGPLRAIRDHRPKFLLTLDADPDADYDGIHRVNALTWLLS